MSKAALYQKVKKDWHHWDDDVYQLASSMASAFETVVDNAEADADLVADLNHMRTQMVQYSAWRDAQVRKETA